MLKKNKIIPWAINLFFVLSLALPLLTYPAKSALAQDPLPKANSATMQYILKDYLGIPYRADGALTPEGSYSLFANENKKLESPGLNCSGFVLAAGRDILKAKTSIAEAKKDRLEDSGPNSRYGEDWDFGWDLILNISEGFERYYLNPNGSKQDPTRLNGFDAKGFDFHARGEMDKLISKMKKDHLYLLSFNRATRKKGYSHMHYHVGLMFLNSQNEALMYQTTSQSAKVYFRNISNIKEKNDFLRAFANTGGVKKYIAVIEIPLAP